MRGRTLVPRSTLPPWLMNVDAFAGIVQLNNDLSGLGFSLLIGDWRLNVNDVGGGEVNDWADALGAGIQLTATAATRRPVITPGVAGIAFDPAGDRMTSNADLALDAAVGGSLVTGASMTGIVGRGIAALFNPDGTKSVRIDTQSATNIIQGHTTTPTNVLTSATGGTVAGATPRLSICSYAGAAPITIDVLDSDSRVSAASAAAMPAGEAYTLQLYHTVNANQSGGVIYYWMWITPVVNAAAMALIRTWSLQNHPDVVLV